MSRSDDTIEIPALGRPFQLGMLYDCRNDSLIPGVTLWDFESLKEDLCIRPQPKTEFEVIASDSIDDKASALNVSASLKVSFLGGLIEVGGSAKYLQDTKKSKQQARVTLQYKTTTKYEQLTMSHLGIQNVTYPSVFDHRTATHVVTAILYGAQAFFIFDREVSSSESVQEIEGSLQVTIKTFISITGEAEIQMDEREKSHCENFSCKFHGDFALERNPVSFQDAMQVYSTLPQMMGEDGEKAVPITVWLYPLTKLDSRAAKMVREISLALIFDAQKVLEELNEIKMRCNDLAKNPIADIFPEIKKKIQHFKDFCKQHRQTFQKELAGVLPSIRGGGKEEEALVDILMSVNQSPFNSQKLHDFLHNKEQEINFVKSYLTILSGIEIVSQNKLEEIVLDPQNVFVVSFMFTSLNDEEPYLSSLKHWLQEQFLRESADATEGGSAADEWEAWFENKEIRQKARKAAKAMFDFARVNKSNGKTHFVVSFVPDEDNPGASIYLYEDGELVSNNFELPPKPLPPLVGDIGHDSVQLTFQPAEYGRANITSYQIEYRISGEEDWNVMNTEDSQETFLLEGLCPNTEYEFRYSASSKPGLSETSDMSKSAKTLPTSPPENLREVTVGSSMISVAWESPSVIAEGVVIEAYKVEYREESGHENNENTDQWNEIQTESSTEFCQIDGMRPQTFYKLRVSAVCTDGAESTPSEEMEASTTVEEEEKARLALTYLQKSTLVVEGEPSVYVLPLEVTSDATTSCLTYHLGEENLRVPNKVIMMMGETGSGKTTLINGMINYILSVQWEDNFRFKLIHEESSGSQTESQTSDITAYVVNHQNGFKVPYSLTIIDTPGFGDTRGIEHDTLITETIQQFFSTPGGIDHIDTICIVAQAHFTELSDPQKYVFDSVLSIFGEDIKDNIQVLVTFADEETPPVLEAIKEAGVPCAEDASGTPVHFKFNNSALFASSEDCFNDEEMLWKMACTSLKTFFDSTNTLEPKSLTLTKEVLQERKQLEVAMEDLQPQIQVALVELIELRKIQRALDQHKDDVEANRNFEYKVEKIVPVEEDISASGNFITNCKNCHFTCHYPCEISEDDLKYDCTAMNSRTRTCRICPGQCAWNDHFNENYKYVYKFVKEKHNFEELKQKYEHSSGELMTAEEVLENLSQEYEEVKHSLEELIEKTSDSLRHLQEIALKPNTLSTPEYIDLLIMSEQEEMKPEYQKRIQLLKEMRKEAEVIQKMAENEALLPEEKDIQEQLEQRKTFSLGKIKKGAVRAFKKLFT